MAEEKFTGSFHASSLLRRSDLVRKTGVKLIARVDGIFAWDENSSSIKRRIQLGYLAGGRR